ncbi:aspartyl protease family protein [Labilibaculum sp.]|uniref:aspartyl protease family protein n=1 Tax=Labilibaculum sp. TaxID=2060723 RepID=UPI003565B9E1
MKNTLIVLLFCLLSTAAKADNFKKVQAVAKLKNKDFCIQLPVEIIDNKYVLPAVRIKGSKKMYRFLLDTGCQSGCISTEIYKELGLSAFFSDSISDGISKKAADFSFIDLSFNGLSFEKVGVSVHTKKELNSAVSCSQIDGVIGYNLMRACVWSFDHNELTVTDDVDHLNNIGQKQKEKISNGTIPLIVGAFVDGFGATMLFDLGDNGTFEVRNSMLKYLRKKELTKGKGSLYSTVIGEIQDTAALKLVKTPGFRFQNDTLKNAITYVGTSSVCSIGAGILNYYNLTFDFPKRNLYVKPILQDFDETKFINFGFKYRIDNGEVVCQFVWANTEAERSNLKPGDQILRINQLDLSDTSRYDKCQLKSIIEQELSGEEITLSVSGQEKAIVLPKKSLFSCSY